MASWLNDYTDAWNSQDEARILSWMTDDIVYEDVALGRRMVGKAEMAQFIRETFEIQPNLMFKIEAEHSADTHYFTEWVMYPLGVRGVSVGTLRDGKVASNHDYWNVAAIQGGQQSSGA